MKRILTFLAVAAAVAACTKAEEDKKDRTPVALEVSYALDGEKIEALALSSKGQTVEVEVKVNNDKLYWNITSDVKWIEIIEEDHRGDGSFKMRVNSNDAFTKRETAHLSFVAGAFSGKQLPVDQESQQFLAEIPYHIRTAAAQSFETTVKVPCGKEWSIVDGEWIHAVKGTGTQVGEADEYTVTITLDANSDVSRLGELSLTDTQGNEAGISIYQFGTEYTYLPDGTMSLPSGGEATVTFEAPLSTVDSVFVPSFASESSVKGANTQTFTVAVEEFLSDCDDGRSVDISYRNTSGTRTHLELPAIWQVYTPAHAICSAAGLKKFAEAVNNEESIAQWQNEAGVVTLLNNIDMNDYEGTFRSIGNEDCPFVSVFDGKYHKIKNFKSTQPLFGHCEGATISGLVIGESTGDASALTVDVSSEYTTIAAPVVGSAVNTKILDCTNYASVNVNILANTDIYIGGIVGTIKGNSSIDGCINEGTITINPSNFEFKCTSTGVGSTVGVGGIAGYSEDITLTSFNNAGSINFVFTTAKMYQCQLCGVGGLIGIVDGKASFSSCNNSTVIDCGTASCKKSNDSWTAMGGLVGAAIGGDVTFTSCTNSVTIDNQQYNNDAWNKATFNGLSCTAGILGAFIGKTGEKATFTGCSNTATISSFRGAAAGIVGYATNAKIDGCTCTGSVDGYKTAVHKTQMHSYGAGMAAVLLGGSIAECDAVCDIKGSKAGSETCTLAGIAAVTSGTVSIYNCRWYGSISKLTAYAEDIQGAIVGQTTDGVTVDNCKAGGFIQSVSSVKLTSDNVESLAKGSGEGAVSAISLWDGK